MSADRCRTGPSGIKAMIFDMDGTLINPVDLHAACWVETVKHIGADVPSDDIRVSTATGGDQIVYGLLPLT
jgi:beta-phosphoglucomutase-like phosphatase (HAD superfamily)